MIQLVVRVSWYCNAPRRSSACLMLSDRGLVVKKLRFNEQPFDNSGAFLGYFSVRYFRPAAKRPGSADTRNTFMVIYIRPTDVKDMVTGSMQTGTERLRPPTNPELLVK